MNYRKWIYRYSTDCRLKYNSDATFNNYVSCVKSFIIKFDKYNEPKETTNIYLHISDNHISKIQSPLSNIKL